MYGEDFGENLLACATVLCAVLYLILPPIAILLTIPLAALWIVYKLCNKPNNKPQGFTDKILSELDEIEADLDEHLAVDNSGGKVVRIENLKKNS